MQLSSSIIQFNEELARRLALYYAGKNIDSDVERSRLEHLNQLIMRTNTPAKRTRKQRSKRDDSNQRVS
jgi:hypothetical protein